MYELLDRINGPKDLKELNLKELEQLCGEIRSYMVECCAVTPGHLGASLGAVELIVGYHYVFDSPEDKIVFDVGHQAYAHKILTGRREAFKTLRTEGGISGFPRRDESPYDAFGAGHSSTSISAALGLAEAARLQGRKEKVVALIGDGALTGGLAFEGLNNAAASKADVLIVLNDNGISIEKDNGGVHSSLLKLTTSHKYNALKNRVWNMMGTTPARNLIQRWTRAAKSFLVRKSGGDIFEAMGLRYFGPINGNDITQVVEALQRLKGLDGPRILHCKTVKGKGYAPAEADPVTWHAPGKFNPATGERIPGNRPADRYQDVFGEVLCELAAKDPRVVGITPAMSAGSGMTCFAEKFPGRFFDVGIEEEHAATFAAGLAAGGIRPFCAIYSSFAQRAYDQIIHDCAMQGLPVVFCFDRAGVVGEDGATHQGAFDLSAYRSIPGVTVSAPRDETELRNLMYTALQHEGGPFIIRYPRGCGEGRAWKDAPVELLPEGKAETLLEGSDAAIVAIGPCVNRALEAAAGFPGKVSVYNFRFLKPLDEAKLESVARTHTHIITMEDGSLKGGLFGAVSEFVAEHVPGVPVKGFGIPDEFVRHASQAAQRKYCGLDGEAVENFLKDCLRICK